MGWSWGWGLRNPLWAPPPTITNISMFRIRFLGRIFHRTSRSHILNNFLPHTPPFPHPQEQFQPHLPSTTPSRPPPTAHPDSQLASHPTQPPTQPRPTNQPPTTARHHHLQAKNLRPATPRPAMTSPLPRPRFCTTGRLCPQISSSSITSKKVSMCPLGLWAAGDTLTKKCALGMEGGAGIVPVGGGRAGCGVGN